ncbi:hypothetical protein [Pedobacter panaciterrae]|uniref:hypothetical protein n=1 Tax=Pedobacter panaciterrae TaxID=363849 RepID=UPI002598901E|nr:hypothetical protein [uncultured Pedobacter sp.]
MKVQNRIAEEMKAIQSRHKRLAGLFSPGIVNSRAFKLEQLKELESLAAKYRRGLNSDERFYKRLLTAEKRQLERNLYPSVLLRLARNLTRLGVALIIAPYRAGKKIGNNIALRQELNKYGLSSFHKQALNKAEQHSPGFSITDRKMVSSGAQLQMDYNFSRDKPDTFSLKDYSISLLPASVGETVSGVRLDAAYGILDEEKLFNLLKGSPVKTEVGTWITLDRNDKDKHGNYQVKAYNYNLEAALRNIKAKEFNNPVLKAAILGNLEMGQKQSVTVKGKRFEIVPDIKAQSIIYYQGSKKIQPSGGDMLATKVLPLKSNEVSNEERVSNGTKKGI